VPVRHLSASALADYRECPMLHIGRRVERWPEVRPPQMAQAMSLGTAVHAALEAHHQGKDAVAALHRYWPSVAATVPADYFGRALSLVRIYTEFEAPDPRDQTERKFTLRIPGVAVPVIGFIDLQRGLVVRDYKTTGSSTWWTQKRADESIQASIYAMAVSAEHHGAQVTVEFHVLTHGKGGYGHRVISTTRTKDDLARVCDEIRADWAAMQQEPREARCAPGRCRFPEQCKEYGYGAVSADEPKLIIG
jgi:hypothetical protein